VANSRDITAKIEKDHQLKLFESVITNTKDAILITDAEPSEGMDIKSFMSMKLYKNDGL
jgi:hypothetical protein